MTWRRTIAAALREGARRALKDSFVEAVRRSPAEAERRLRAVANLASMVLGAAELLDPGGTKRDLDAAARAGDIGDRRAEPRAAAAASFERARLETLDRAAVPAREQTTIGGSHRLDPNAKPN